MIGYGAMLTESFVAIMALAAACVLDPGLYFAMNMPGTVLGTTVETASAAVAKIGYTITPQDLAAAAAAVEEEKLFGRTGGAPTLAVGLSQIFSEVIGGDALRAFWYHFAIMFEALFILTTVDAGTRVGRFMLQDTVGNLWPRYRDTTWKPAAWSASAIIVGLWGYLLWAGVNDPLGGIYQLFPLFGIANQLLAAVALAVCTTLLIKSGRAKYAWITIVPLAFDAAVTLTASYQKIFSADPKLGFWAQRNQYQDALDAGKTSLGTAKTPEDMQQVVFNTTLDTALTALFAILIVIVLADAIRVWIAALSGRPLSSGSEDPYVESKLWAPAGLIPTREEREHQRERRAGRRLRGAIDDRRRSDRGCGTPPGRPGRCCAGSSASGPTRTTSPTTPRSTRTSRRWASGSSGGSAATGSRRPAAADPPTTAPSSPTAVPAVGRSATSGDRSATQRRAAAVLRLRSVPCFPPRDALVLDRVAGSPLTVTVRVRSDCTAPEAGATFRGSLRYEG